MTHDKARLTDYVLGELSETQVQELELHLASCAACREDVRVLREAFVSVVDALPVAVAPEGAWQKIAQRLDADAPAFAREEQVFVPPVPRTSRNVWSWRPLALVASFVLLAGGLFWGVNTRQSYVQLQQEQRKVAGWLSRPDVVAQQLTDANGERLGSVLTLSDGRALFVLRSTPPAGSRYQAWGYENDAPVTLGLTGRTLLEVPYENFDALLISLEPKQGSVTPTRPLGSVKVPAHGDAPGS